MARLGEVCVPASSNLLQKDLEKSEGEYAVYGASGFIKNVGFFQRDEPYIAVVKDGAGVGRVMRLPEKTSVIGTMQYIIPKPNVDIGYLAYAMEFMKLGKYHKGATIPHIYFRDYKEEEIPLPPLDEQRKISALLDKVSRLIALSKQQAKMLDVLARARFVEMFGDPVLNPKGWEVARLGEVCRVVTGTTPSTYQPEYWNGTLNWVTPAELKSDIEVITETQRKITQQAVIDTGLKPFPSGTVLLSSRAPIGKIAIAGTEMYCNQGFKNLVCSDIICNRYLAYFLMERKQYIKSLGRGTTFKEISKTIVENITIPLPPLALQQEFAAFAEKAQGVKAAVMRSLEQLETLKKALMQKFFFEEAQG